MSGMDHLFILVSSFLLLQWNTLKVLCFTNCFGIWVSSLSRPYIQVKYQHLVQYDPEYFEVAIFVSCYVPALKVVKTFLWFFHSVLYFFLCCAFCIFALSFDSWTLVFNMLSVWLIILLLMTPYPFFVCLKNICFIWLKQF